MDLRFLESFVVVADCGSIAGAAKRLSLTPAALAQRIRALEADIGQPLVTRVGRSVRPTESGLAILAYARDLIDQGRNLRGLAAVGEPAGRVKLGAVATAMVGIIPEIVARLSARYPRIEFYLRPSSSLELYQAVVAGDLDAAVIVKTPFALPKGVGWLPMRREELLLISPEGSCVDNPHETIEQEPFIRYDRDQWGGQIVDRYLRRNCLKVRELLELDALDAIAALVHRGLGVAVVPDWAKPWPEGLRITKTRLPGTEMREMGVLWNRVGARSAAVTAFVDVCSLIAAL